jgi:hypothetical protein
VPHPSRTFAKGGIDALNHPHAVAVAFVFALAVAVAFLVVIPKGSAVAFAFVSHVVKTISRAPQNQSSPLETLYFTVPTLLPEQ